MYNVKNCSFFSLSSSSFYTNSNNSEYDESNDTEENDSEEIELDEEEEIKERHLAAECQLDGLTKGLLEITNDKNKNIFFSIKSICEN